MGCDTLGKGLGWLVVDGTSLGKFQFVEVEALCWPGQEETGFWHTVGSLHWVLAKAEVIVN